MRKVLERLRGQIQAAAPEATEYISYGMPAFKYRGKPLAGFAAFKAHCSLFPMSGAVIEANQEALKEYRTSKGTVQFMPEKPLPAALIRRVIKARMAEIEAKARK
jgi:uncharacterized protein YdhG (YjbR/CyaY superfamily)